MEQFETKINDLALRANQRIDLLLDKATASAPLCKIISKQANPMVRTLKALVALGADTSE